MHGRRFLKQKETEQHIKTHIGEQEEVLQFVEFEKKGTKFIISEAMEEEVNNQHEPTSKELSAPSDYEAFTKISAPLNENANFKIDATMLNFLSSFNGRFSDETYEFLWEFTQFCSSYYFLGISQEVVKLMLFPFALKDRAREWLNGTGKTFTSWQEVQTSFLQKYFSYGRTHALRKVIRDFMQGNETFGEAWERFMTLTRKCPHHGIPNHELAQIFYQGLDYQERQLVDISSGGNFLNTRASESLKRLEELVEDWVFRQSSKIDTKTGGLKRGVIDLKGMEADIKMEKLEREMKQSVIDITENFKHLLKDAIATIKLDVNLAKGNSDLTCMNCTSNDHIQDKGEAILTEQVNAFGAHSNHNNWNAGNNGNKMTNFGNNVDSMDLEFRIINLRCQISSNSVCHTSKITNNSIIICTSRIAKFPINTVNRSFTKMQLICSYWHRVILIMLLITIFGKIRNICRIKRRLGKRRRSFY